jgi:hypothetical protein
MRWHDLRHTVPLISKRLQQAAAAACSQEQLHIKLGSFDSTFDQGLARWLQRRARQLFNVRISWLTMQDNLQMLAVLQALTVRSSAAGVPASRPAEHAAAALRTLVLQVCFDADGTVLYALADLLAGTLQLQHLELLPVSDHEDACICEQKRSSATAAAFGHLLDTPTLCGITNLTVGKLPPFLVLNLVQHSNLQQLESLQLQGVCWGAAGGRDKAGKLLDAVSTNMQRLQQLSLSNTQRMIASPAAFRRLAAGLPQLRQLDISQCERLCAAMPGRDSALLSFTQLRRLKVSSGASSSKQQLNNVCECVMFLQWHVLHP